MKLYLIQHAKAASDGVDPTRPLSDQGRRDAQKIAAFIEHLKINVDYIWHSGKKRAEQTAEILAGAVKVENEMIIHKGLAPNDDVKVIKDQILDTQGDIMIVSHMPFVSKLASLLLTGEQLPGVIAFKQGGVVCLEYTDLNRWQVAWIVTPELLE